MTTTTFNNIRSRASNRTGPVSRAITRIIAGLKETRRRDRRKIRQYSYLKENLLDKNMGPEIARTLR